MIRASAAKGRYAPDAPDEVDFVIGGRRTWTLGEQPLGVIVAHGSGADASSTIYSLRTLLHSIAKHATVHVADLGFQTWGSDLVVTRIEQGKRLLAGEFGVESVALLGVSMGGCSVLNYAVRHPENLACVAAVIPLVDLADARSNPWLTGRWPELDALYGAPPDNDYTGHSPVGFASDLPADLPIRIWSSSDDGLARPATHEAFVAVRPQTELTDIGPVGHSVPIAENAGIIGWIASHLLAGYEPSTYPVAYPATY